MLRKYEIERERDYALLDDDSESCCESKSESSESGISNSQVSSERSFVVLGGCSERGTGRGLVCTRGSRGSCRRSSGGSA